MLPLETHLGVLHFICDQKPVCFNEVLALWARVQNYVALETIVDLSISRHISLSQAEQDFKDWWYAYQQMSWL